MAELKKKRTTKDIKKSASKAKVAAKAKPAVKAKPTAKGQSTAKVSTKAKVTSAKVKPTKVQAKTKVAATKVKPTKVQAKAKVAATKAKSAKLQAKAKATTAKVKPTAKVSTKTNVTSAKKATPKKTTTKATPKKTEAKVPTTKVPTTKVKPAVKKVPEKKTVAKNKKVDTPKKDTAKKVVTPKKVTAKKVAPKVAPKKPASKEQYDDAYIMSIRGDEAKINDFIEKHMPMIQARASLLSKKYYTMEYDDLVTTVALAFNEAIEKFPTQKGHFYPYAELIIQRRAIDEFRKEVRKTKGEVSYFQQDYGGDQTDNPAFDAPARKQYKDDQKIDNVTSEMEQFEEKINDYGITLDALTKTSPKQRVTLDKLKEIVLKIYNSSTLKDEVLNDKAFNLGTLSDELSCSPKILKKFRNYILAVLIIRESNYEALSEFIFNE